MSSKHWKFNPRRFPTLGTRPACDRRRAAGPRMLQCSLLPAVLLLAACGPKPGGAPGAGGPGGPPGGFKVPVEVAPVEQRDWNVLARAVGTLAADEMVTVRNLVAGYIKDIPGVEGARVKADEPVVLIDDEKLRYELDRASARNDEASSTLRRRQPLFNQKLITEAEIVEAQAAAAAAEAEWALARRTLADATVRTPIAGTLGRRYVSPGDYAPVGTKLFDLVKTDALKLDFSLPESLLTKIATGQQVRVTTGAYPGRAFTGTVDFIEPMIDEATRTVRARARVDNREGLLKPNLFVNVEVAVDTIRNAYVLPEEAVIPSLGGNSVFVVIDGAARRRSITIADRSPGRVAVREGFQAGEQIVTTGHQKLADHVPVMPLPPGGMAELMKQQQMQQKGPPGAAGGPPGQDKGGNSDAKSETPSKPGAAHTEPPKKPVNEVVTPPVSAPPEEDGK